MKTLYLKSLLMERGRKGANQNTKTPDKTPERILTVYYKARVNGPLPYTGRKGVGHAEVGQPKENSKQ